MTGKIKPEKKLRPVFDEAFKVDLASVAHIIKARLFC